MLNIPIFCSFGQLKSAGTTEQWLTVMFKELLRLKNFTKSKEKSILFAKSQFIRHLPKTEPNSYVQP